MASDLKLLLQADLNAARKSRDKLRTLVLSTVLADLRNREIDDRVEADDDVVLQVLTKAIKQRNDAAEQMRAAGREELAEGEEAQVEILDAYRPVGLSEDDVRALVHDAMASGIDQMGPLMAHIMPKIRGRFDGKEANRIVREALGG